MGELILCNQNMAAFPYYVEEAAIGVYSAGGIKLLYLPTMSICSAVIL